MFKHMRGMKKIINAALVLLMVGSVAGCGASSAEETAGKAVGISDKESAQGQMNIEIPVQIPGILVDQNGYNIESDKVVVFKGKKLPKTFQIIDMETNQVVYTGDVVKPTFDENSDYFYAVGRFNELKNRGQYYIYADYLGESYSFRIAEDIYSEVFTEACKKYYINRCGIAISEGLAGDNGHSACHTTPAHLKDDSSTTIDVLGGWHMDDKADRDTLLGSRIVENLLLSYELDKAAFGDDLGIPESGNNIPDILDEAKYEVDWLLKMQDPKTGGVFGAALTENSGMADVFAAPVELTAVSMEATISFAAALARFSFFYQQYDPEYATSIIRAADRAWECYLNNQRASSNTASFKAAAQLYRATGNEKYEAVLNEYVGRTDFETLFNTDENILLGAVTYLSTNQHVDKDICSELIKYLMKKSELIAKEASNSRYLTSVIAVDGDFSQFLDDIRCLTITNHIIYNHEYTTIIENHLHYLMGMNPEAMNYLASGTERTYLDSKDKNNIMNNPHSDSIIVFMLSGLKK